jgi:hypothetical protein
MKPINCYLLSTETVDEEVLMLTVVLCAAKISCILKSEVFNINEITLI